MVLRSALGALRGVLFGVLEAPRTLFRRSARAFSGPPIVFEVTWGVADMVHWGFTVRLGINGQNPRRPFSIVDRKTVFSGSAAVGAAQSIYSGGLKALGPSNPEAPSLSPPGPKGTLPGERF